MKSLKVPCPPLPEQQKIAEILSAVDEKIEVERKRKEKLEVLKKGLMQVLLTGKIRVNVGATFTVAPNNKAGARPAPTGRGHKSNRRG